MGFSYKAFNYCASGCGPNQGWFPKVVEVELNPGVIGYADNLFCPECGRRLRVRNRDINRWWKATLDRLRVKKLET